MRSWRLSVSPQKDHLVALKTPASHRASQCHRPTSLTRARPPRLIPPLPLRAENPSEKALVRLRRRNCPKRDCYEICRRRGASKMRRGARRATSVPERRPRRRPAPEIDGALAGRLARDLDDESEVRPGRARRLIMAAAKVSRLIPRTPLPPRPSHASSSPVSPPRRIPRREHPRRRGRLRGTASARRSGAPARAASGPRLRAAPSAGPGRSRARPRPSRAHCGPRRGPSSRGTGGPPRVAPGPARTLLFGRGARR